MILALPRFASVYPLVTARALARPFTYLADGVEKGSVVTDSALSNLIVGRDARITSSRINGGFLGESVVVENNAVTEFRVTMRVSFVLD